MSMRTLKQRRIKLWKQDPHCHWCGTLTILPPADAKPHRKNYPLNEATIDHLRSRWHPNRREPIRQGEQRLVLSCRKCNIDRAKQEEKEQGLEVLHVAAQNGETGRKEKMCQH